MASNRIKGITIEIDGNTTPLTKSLKDVDKSLKDTQGELKDVNKLLKLDPTNVELLRQKNNLLKDAIDKTKERQKQLIEALEQAKKAGDTEENRKQQDALQRELIETTQTLQTMEREMSGAGSSTKEAEKSVSTFGDTLKAKLTAEAVIAGVKKLAKGLSELAMGAVTLSDDLATQAQVTGLSTDALQEYNYMAELVDVSVDTITGSMTKLTRNMKSAQGGTGTAATAFQKLAVRVTNLDGSLRSNDEVFNDVIDALGNVANETERDALAMEIFGKSAQELNPLINAGSAQIKAYAKEAHDMGYVMSEDVIQKNVQASDAYQRMQNSIQTAKNEIGSEFAPVIEKAADIVQKLIQAARDNSDVVKKLAGVVAGAVAGFIAYKAAVAAASAATALMAANPVTLCIAALAALVTAAALTSDTEIQLSEDTKKLISDMDALAVEIDEDTKSLKNLEDAKKKNISAAESEEKYYTDLAKELDTIVDANGKVMIGYEDRAKTITGVLSQALGIEIDLTDGQIKNYQQIQTEIYNVIAAKKAEAILKAQEEGYTKAVNGRMEAEVKLTKATIARKESIAALQENQEKIKALEAEYQEIAASGVKVMTARQHAILDEIDALNGQQGALRENIDEANSKLKDAQNTVATYAYNIEQYEKNLALAHDKNFGEMSTVTVELIKAYQSATAAEKAELDKQYGTLLSEATRQYNAAYGVGKQLIHGMKDGVNDKAAQDQAYGAVTSFSNNLLAKSRAALQVRSPSKAAAEIGRYFVEGFGIGIEDEAQTAYNEVAAFGRNALSALQTAASGGVNLTGLASVGANTLVNSRPGGSMGDVSVAVTINGNVDDYDALASTIGQKLQQQMARQQRAWA